jgi:stage V sporulation protein B
MKKMSLLIYNTLLLTGASLVLRTAGLYLQSYVSGKVGAEGVGLFQLILSVQALAVTLATSGIRYSVTRLVSEELGALRQGGVRPVMRRCFTYSLFFSFVAFTILYVYSDEVALLAGDARIGNALRLLSIGLPFLSLSSVIGGYFTAVMRPWKGALIQLFEQAAMITAVFMLLPLAEGRNLAASCSAIACSGTLADASAFILAVILFILDMKGLEKAAAKNRGLTTSSYARTALSSLQHMMIPSALKRSGASAERALSTYGCIHGMAFPVLYFPSAFFLALADVLIPELTEAQVRDDKERMNRTAGKILTACLLFSSFMALVFFIFGKAFGLALYGSIEAGRYISLMAPLVIVMYMDMVTDGILKGLGMQLDSMIINISDALLCVIMVYFLVPVWAEKAYVGIIFLSECYNFVLSFIRLSKVVNIRLTIKAL